MNPELMNSLVLAYLGDSIIELMVREYLIRNSASKKVNDLYHEATHFVSSDAHADFVGHCLENKFFTEHETAIYKRGRNTRNHKNETAQHRHSTGFEALIGYLYLNDEKARIDEIFAEFIRFVSETDLK